MANDYKIHPDLDLNREFHGYQGTKPEDAKFIFLALDANYTEDFSTSSIKNDIIEFQKNYHDWIKKNANIHHPFMNKDLKYKKDGLRYHQNFGKLNLSLKARESLCFLELFGKPTVGRTGNNEDFILSNDNLSHLKRIHSVICNGSGKFIFLTSKVIAFFPKIAKNFGLKEFNDLYKLLKSADKSKAIEYKGNYYIKHTHFSGSQHPKARIENDIPLIKDLILKQFGSDMFK